MKQTIIEPIMKKYKNIFTLGYKNFFMGKHEFDFPFKMNSLQKKEYVRGWNQAYFKSQRIANG